MRRTTVAKYLLVIMLSAASVASNAMFRFPFVLPLPVISPPTLAISEEKSTDGSWTLSWTASAGATTYILEESAGGGSFGEVYRGSGRSKTIEGKRANIEYYYRIKACQSYRCSVASPAKKVRLEYAHPSTLAGIPASSANGTFTVRWSMPKLKMHTAELQRKSPGSSGWTTVVGRGRSSSKAQSNLTSGTYSYRLVRYISPYIRPPFYFGRSYPQLRKQQKTEASKSVVVAKPGKPSVVIYGEGGESPQSEVMPMGTDSDRDGVRDDVQKKIEEKYGKNTPVTNYSMDMAKGFQKLLSGALSHKQINQQLTQINHLNECIQNKTNAKDAGLQFLLPEQLNTVARTRAYLKAAAEAYDKAGPPNVKPCGSKAKTRGPTVMNGLVASSQGGGMLRGNSNASARLNPPNLKDYDVFFINGVMNTREYAKETKKKLERMLNQKVVKLEYNKNHMLGQLFDLWVHKVGEIEVDKTGTIGFWQLVRTVAFPGDNIRKALYEWLDPDRDIGHWAEKDLKRMIETAKTALNQNKKVITVAHSEGNFFYRNIHKALNQWNSTKTQQCFAGIGFATPLSSKHGNYGYITSTNDKVINLVRDFWNSTLVANITVPQGHGGDLLGHGMQNVYLSHPVSLRQLKTELDQVTNRLNESCKIKKEKKKQPQKQPKPPLSCSSPVGKGGGQGQYSYSYPIKNTTAHKVEISFEAYNIPDRIKITANGKKIAQTNGYVGGYHQWQINYEPMIHGKEFVAHVDAPNGGTAWQLCIDCEGSSCGGNIKRKKVYYGFLDSRNWKCNNYQIDGHNVNQNGEKYLSVGKHSFSASCSCNTIGRFCTNPFYGFPVIFASGSSCFNPRSNKSCSILSGSKVLGFK